MTTMSTIQGLLNAEHRAANVVSLTPTPITTVAVGGWVKCQGTPGFVEVILTGTAPTATVLLEFTNSQIPTTYDYAYTWSMSGDGSQKGGTTLTGPLWMRVNVTAINGVGAAVDATVAWS